MFFNKKKKGVSEYLDCKLTLLNIEKKWYNESEERIIDILYNFLKRGKLSNDDLCQANFLSNLIFSGKYHIHYNLFQKFQNKPEQLEELLLNIPDSSNIKLLKCISSMEYTYEMLTKVVFPHYDKLVYIVSMVEGANFCDENEVLNILEKNILLPYCSYDVTYNYNKLYDLVKKHFNGEFKPEYYCFDYYVLKSLIFEEKYSIEDVSEILKECSKLLPYSVQNKLIPTLVKAGFSKEELLEFLPIVLKMEADNRDKVVDKIKIFLRASTKEELFKKIFEITNV